MKIHIEEQIIEIPMAEGLGMEISNNALFKIVRMQKAMANSDYEISFWSFIEEWVNDKEYIIAQTSGSTGIPREIQLKKTAVIASAKRTNAFFDLKSGMNVWLCMDCKYIGAKLMVIRALVGNMNLYITAPTKEPLQKLIEQYSCRIDFAAMVPMQLHHIAIENIESLQIIQTLIIGGGTLPHALAKFIQTKDISTKIYETYGMTETISHIAVKKMKEPYFKALPGVEIRQDEEGCALIEDSILFENQMIQTHDIIELHGPNTFKIIGRIDNIINSGGIKISPEALEEKIKHLVSVPFIISSAPDEVLGNKIVFIYESNTIDHQIAERIKSSLSKYEMPKEFIPLEHFDYLENLKIDRIKTRLKAIARL